MSPDELAKYALLPQQKAELLAAYEQFASSRPANILEDRRRRFVDKYGPDALRSARQDDQALLIFFLGPQAGSGLFYELERQRKGNPTLGQDFGSVMGGSAKKFFVWRHGTSFKRAGGSKQSEACSEEEAIGILRNIAEAVDLAYTATDYFDLDVLNTDNWGAFAQAMVNESIAQKMSAPVQPSIKLLHVGWLHKYLAMVTDNLSYFHQAWILTNNLRHLTGQEPPQNRWLCDLVWQHIFKEDSDFTGCHHALLMLASDSLTPATSTTKQPRYWAGGHFWADGSHLEEFQAENGWWYGYGSDDASTGAVQTRAIFEQISVRDFFAIKGYGGRDVLKVHYVGQVIEVDKEEQRVLFDPMPLPNPQSIRPGTGTGSWFPTLREVTNPAIIAWMFGQKPYSLTSPPTEDAMSDPLNTIFYGPPGTGKTYTTIHQAVKIITGNDYEGIEAKEQWDKLRSEGRIEFVTFHQSFGYEDFLEGIRPVLTSPQDDEEAGTARYVIASGVLKRLALKALGATLKSKATGASGTLPTLNLRSAWGKFEEAFEEEGQTVTYRGRTHPIRYRITSMSYAAIRGKNDQRLDTQWEQIASFARITKLWDEYAKPNSGPITGAEVEHISDGRGAHYAFIAAVYNRLLEIAQSQGANTPITAEPTEEQRAADYLARGADNSDYEIVKNTDVPRYVLAIDEINRGNISKIFGELITLIEDDKRIGGGLDMTVTLPFSGDTFGLPKNLYLIGTMNTADKSIALVDVALRRRFEFEEMMPRFDVCKHLTDPMREALTQLNRRIVLRKDRDHQIGHAFFVRVTTVEEFNRAFEKKVIPLLQEYFYADWDGLRYVLGVGDSGGSFIVKLDGDTGSSRSRNVWQWYRDKGNSLDCLAALCANYKIGMAGGAPPVAGVDGDAGTQGAGG